MSAETNESGDVVYSYYGTAYDNDAEAGLTHTRTTSLRFTPKGVEVVKEGFDQETGRSANSMESYYITLTDIIEYSKANNVWTINNNVYSTTDATMLDYFREFTAPCFLKVETTSNYLQYETATIEVVDDNLVLSLKLVSDGTNSGVLTDDTKESLVFSQATIKKASKLDFTYEYENGDVAGEAYTLVLANGDLYGKEETLAPSIDGFLPNYFWFAGVAEGNKELKVTYSECDIWDGSVATEFAGGTGTEEDPYLISSGAQLAYLASLANEVAAKATYGSGVYFKLTKSIDLNNLSWTPIAYAGGATTSWKWFGGNFDGTGKTIAGLNFDQTEKYGAGLFTAIKGTVSDLTIEGEVNALHRAGALCYYTNGATIENIKAFANITTTGNSSGCYTGGLIGSSVSTTITNCESYGKVTGAYTLIGGISGKSSTSTFTNCSNFGDVMPSLKSVKYIGGIVGQTGSTITVIGCKNYGNIGTSSVYAEQGSAGIIGWATNETSVTSSINYGNIIGKFTVGGITGYTGASVQISDDCVNYGQATKRG